MTHFGEGTDAVDYSEDNSDFAQIFGRVPRKNLTKQHAPTLRVKQRRVHF